MQNKTRALKCKPSAEKQCTLATRQRKAVYEIEAVDSDKLKYKYIVCRYENNDRS